MLLAGGLELDELEGGPLGVHPTFLVDVRALCDEEELYDSTTSTPGTIVTLPTTGVRRTIPTFLVDIRALCDEEEADGGVPSGSRQMQRSPPVKVGQRQIDPRATHVAQTLQVSFCRHPDGSHRALSSEVVQGRAPAVEELHETH